MLKPDASQAKLQSPGDPVSNLDQSITKTKFKRKHTFFGVFVLKGETDCLLSRAATLKLGLVKRLDDMRNLAFGDIGVPVKCDLVKIMLSDDA